MKWFSINHNEGSIRNNSFHCEVGWNQGCKEYIPIRRRMEIPPNGNNESH